MPEFEALVQKLARWPERANYIMSPAERTVLMRGILDLKAAPVDPLSRPDAFKGAKGPHDT
jgi:hypothetical protein